MVKYTGTGIRPDIKIRYEAGQCERLVLGFPTIGKCFWVGPWTILDASGGDLIIGDYCTVCAGVKIYTHTNERYDMHEREPYRDNVTIGDRCFIGSNAIIEPGVKLGNYVKIGANSFVRRGTVTGDNETWAGCPAKRRR